MLPRIRDTGNTLLWPHRRINQPQRCSHAIPPPPRRFTREALDVYRRRYEETDEPQSSIAADLRVQRKTLDRLAKREGDVDGMDRCDD